MKKRQMGLSLVILGFFGISLTLLFFIKADAAATGVRRGFALCLDTLFPALFPFLVVSELLIASGIVTKTAKWFKVPMQKIFGVSGKAAPALFLGILCGFPTGALTAAELCDRGDITEKEFQRLFLFVNNPGAGFLISAVGGALFGNKKAGMALFAIVLLSAALIGIFLHILFGSAETTGSAGFTPYKEIKTGASMLTASIKKAGITLLQVGAFILFFSAFGTCLRSLPIFEKLPESVQVALLGIFEMTTGMGEAVISLPPETAFLFCAFFAGMSGLSVCLQVFAVTEGKGHSPIYYLIAKLLQGGLCLLLAKIYLYLCHPILKISADALWQTGFSINNGEFFGCWTGCFCIILLLCLLFGKAMTLLLAHQKKKREKIQKFSKKS